MARSHRRRDGPCRRAQERLTAAQISLRVGDPTVEQAGPAARLLLTLAPFALLHPIGYLVRSAEYSAGIDWIYAAVALVIMILSQRRQRRSFYYAGLLNFGVALYLIAHRREWFDQPAWAIAVIAAGVAALGIGFALDRAERQKST